MHPLPLLIEINDPVEPYASSGPAHRRDIPRSFLQVLGEHLDRRYEQENQRRIREMKDIRRSDSSPAPTVDHETARSGDFAMYKLYMSMLLKLGGAAPVIAPSDPGATALMRDTLQTRLQGARAPFSRDSDLYSLPRFPVTSVE